MLINFKAILKFTYLPKLFLIPTVFICVSLVNISSLQASRLQTPNKTVVRQRIAKIISDTLNQGKGIVKGISVSIRVPPSNEAIEEIKNYGDDAVPVLVEYFHSESSSERELALTLLGCLGGERIVAPLRDVILHDSSSSFRELALRWIVQAPWDTASLIILEAAETDANEHVRQEALNILGEHGHE
ncbi:MAG: HEAT repeat domain-containing protein [Pyrinomonadaceae bacterium]